MAVSAAAGPGYRVVPGPRVERGFPACNSGVLPLDEPGAMSCLPRPIPLDLLRDAGDGPSGHRPSRR